MREVRAEGSRKEAKTQRRPKPGCVMLGAELTLFFTSLFVVRDEKGGWVRWGNTRSLCFANFMECENYHPNLAHDCIATSSLKRSSVLSAPSSPPPLAPARGRRGAKRIRLFAFE